MGNCRALYIIDQVWGQDGWILAKFFFGCLWTEMKSRSINSQKRTKRIYYMAFGKFFLRDTAGSPERARWLHLVHSGSQSHCAMWFIFPTQGASHIIISHNAHGSFTGLQKQSKKPCNKQLINHECSVLTEKSQTLTSQYWPHYRSINMTRSRSKIFLQ